MLRKYMQTIQMAQINADLKRRAGEIQIQMAMINAARDQAKIQADTGLAHWSYKPKLSSQYQCHS